MKNIDLAIIGGGPAGLAAAVKAKQMGLKDVVVFERDSFPGGILKQCIHNGFGLEIFNEELSGPEYAERYIKMAQKENVNIELNSMVVELNNNKEIAVISPYSGYNEYRCKSVILSMGCRERPRGATDIAGTRPAGVYTAGHAQRLINIEGIMPGKKVIIFGSGDIGMIMARRLTLEGAKVEAVLARRSYANGLTRNIVQCLNDYNIPLYLKSGIIEIYGRSRVEGVAVIEYDEQLNPLPNTERYIECDTVLLSVGLIPENELTKMTGLKMDNKTGGPYINNWFETEIPGLFACGNVVHVNDIVDNASREAEIAAIGAYNRLNNIVNNNCSISVEYSEKTISQIIPHNIVNLDYDLDINFRVKKPMGKNIVRVGSCFEKKYPFQRPAEMIRITIPKEVLKDIGREKTMKVICEEI